MKLLLIADHDNRKLGPQTARLLDAARQIGGEAEILVMGDACGAVADEAARLEGASRVRLLMAPHYAGFLVENLAMVIAQLGGSYTHVLFSTSSLGKSLMPRVAAMLDVAPVSDVIRIAAPDCFVRPSHAGNVIETVLCEEPVKLLSVRASAFAPVAANAAPVVVAEVPAGPDMGVSRLVSAVQSAGNARPDLESARVVVAGGRGAGSREAFDAQIGGLADCFGAALGASRAAVDQGYAPNEWQVGQTGRSVAPALYVAVGISGAVQHVCGMRDAACVVAINKDPEAPMFAHADLGMVGDLHEIVPQLIAALRQ